MRRNPQARSYADVPTWRTYEDRLPSVLHLANERPEEEWWRWRDVGCRVDRLPAPDAPAELVPCTVWAATAKFSRRFSTG